MIEVKSAYTNKTGDHYTIIRSIDDQGNVERIALYPKRERTARQWIMDACMILAITGASVLGVGLGFAIIGFH